MAKIDRSAIIVRFDSDESIFISSKNGKNHIYSMECTMYMACFGISLSNVLSNVCYGGHGACAWINITCPQIQIHDTSLLLRGLNSLLTSSSKELYRFFPRLSNLLRANDKIKKIFDRFSCFFFKFRDKRTGFRWKWITLMFNFNMNMKW